MAFTSRYILVYVFNNQNVVNHSFENQPTDFVFPFLQPLKLKGLGKELFYQEVNYCMRQSSLMGSMIGENEQ